MYAMEVQEVINKFVTCKKMYEKIRLVDPIIKKIISYENNTVNELAFKCYDCWGKSKVCDDCISIRAFNENRTLVKVDYTPNKIYIVTAIPVELSNRRKIVIELFEECDD